jgi:hypothetical protein
MQPGIFNPHHDVIMKQLYIRTMESNESAEKNATLSLGDTHI